MILCIISSIRISDSLDLKYSYNEVEYRESLINFEYLYESAQRPRKIITEENYHRGRLYHNDTSRNVNQNNRKEKRESRYLSSSR